MSPVGDLLSSFSLILLLLPFGIERRHLTSDLVGSYLLNKKQKSSLEKQSNQIKELLVVVVVVVVVVTRQWRMAACHVAAPICCVAEIRRSPTAAAEEVKRH